jgi:hypothetical protein
MRFALRIRAIAYDLKVVRIKPSINLDGLWMKDVPGEKWQKMGGKSRCERSTVLAIKGVDW